MDSRSLVVLAGLAAAGQALGQAELQTAPFSGEVVRAVRATAITGLTVDGRYVYGRTIELGQGAWSRGAAVVAYDSGQFADTDGDGLALDPVCADVFPHTFSSPGSRYFINTAWQSAAEDIVPHPGTEGTVVDSFAIAGQVPLCDGGTGTVSEQLTIVLESWEGFGASGFDTDGDGLGFPFSRSDTDGDTFVDEFIGGVLLDYGIQASSGAGGYGLYTATALGTLGLVLTSNLDLWDNGNPGMDGQPDGGVRILWTRGDGGDGMGPLIGGLYPSSRAIPMIWGTLAMQVPGTTCPFAGQPGFGVGDSTGIVWGEGQSLCPTGSGWSDGNPSGNVVVDEQYDVIGDIVDWTGIVPDFNAIGPMFKIAAGFTTPDPYDCCDTNSDSMCTPADFSAWIAAFNAMSPRCDTNDDGACSPADFSAWIAAFNASNGGNPLQCTE